MEKEREKFSSRLGFILISAGCAIGLGNVMAVSVVSRESTAARLCADLSVFPAGAGSAHYGYGVCRGTCKSEKHCHLL